MPELPPLPPKWSCSDARDLIATRLRASAGLARMEANVAAGDAVEALVAAGWTLLPPGEWAAVQGEIVALAEALGDPALTHEFEPAEHYPTRCDRCTASSGVPHHRTPARVRAEHRLGAAWAPGGPRSGDPC